MGEAKNEIMKAANKPSVDRNRIPGNTGIQLFREIQITQL